MIGSQRRTLPLTAVTDAINTNKRTVHCCQRLLNSFMVKPSCSKVDFFFHYFNSFSEYILTCQPTCSCSIDTLCILYTLTCIMRTGSTRTEDFVFH